MRLTTQQEVIAWWFAGPALVVVLGLQDWRHRASRVDLVHLVLAPARPSGPLASSLDLLGVAEGHQDAQGLLPSLRGSTGSEPPTRAAGTASAASPKESSGKKDVAGAEACLRLTSPELRLEYPSDAEQHFQQIHAEMKTYTEKNYGKSCYAGYCGLQIEDYWREHFWSAWENRKTGTRLSDIFGPYIPLLMPYLRVWIQRHRYPEGFMEKLQSLLRPTVPYITVSQNDDSLMARGCPYGMEKLPSVTVLSAGGYGHVPVPLLLGEKKLLAPPISKPVAERQVWAEYMGTVQNAKRVRPKMKEDVLAEVSSGALKGKEVKLGKQKDWVQVSADSRFHLVPRGYGRSAYRLMEMLQMGLVPIYIYNDVPWVPYINLWDSAGRQEKEAEEGSAVVGFVTSSEGLRPLLGRLARLSDAAVERLETRIRAVRESHFLPPGIMEHIARFMTGRQGGGDLVCQKLPPHVH